MPKDSKSQLYGRKMSSSQSIYNTMKASSSRQPFHWAVYYLGGIRHVSGSHRYVKGKPKPAKTPILRSPHFPKLPLPSSGASQPHPQDLSPIYTPTTTSVPLDTGGLVLHHSPPPSAPSHTIGLVPPLLRWLGGESVSLSGEEGAPLLHERREAMGDVVGTWSDKMITHMRKMRTKGKSRLEIVRRWVVGFSAKPMKIFK